MRVRLHGRRRRLEGLDYSDQSLVFFLTLTVPTPFRDNEQGPFCNRDLASSVVDSLLQIREKRGIKLFSYCLMPDHLHLLLSLHGSGVSLSDVMRDFKSFTTRAAWSQGVPRLWQRGYYEHVVRDEIELRETLAYVRNNPVRAGLVDRADAYPYSATPDQPLNRV